MQTSATEAIVSQTLTGCLKSQGLRCKTDTRARSTSAGPAWAGLGQFRSRTVDSVQIGNYRVFIIAKTYTLGILEID